MGEPVESSRVGKSWKVACGVCFVGGLLLGWCNGHFLAPPFGRTGQYSIGIYAGRSPFTVEPCSETHNPVLSAKDVTDTHAAFLADPFLVKENGGWYMFFEVMNATTQKGSIGLATSRDGLKWSYQQIVLDEPFHLSYPYVFKWQEDYYMIPESHQAYHVRLYRAEQFPTRWTFVKDLLRGDYSDSSICHVDGRWWIFTADRYDVLHLFSAADLMGEWTEHPCSPIICGDGHSARPGGRILEVDGRLFRFAQDCDPAYGQRVYVFEITEMTPTTYHEKAALDHPIIKGSGKGWNAERMHHVDLHQCEEGHWIASVDGYARSWGFRSPFQARDSGRLGTEPR